MRAEGKASSAFPPLPTTERQTLIIADEALLSDEKRMQESFGKCSRRQILPLLLRRGKKMRYC